MNLRLFLKKQFLWYRIPSYLNKGIYMSDYLTYISHNRFWLLQLRANSSNWKVCQHQCKFVSLLNLALYLWCTLYFNFAWSDQRVIMYVVTIVHGCEFWWVIYLGFLFFSLRFRFWFIIQLKKMFYSLKGNCNDDQFLKNIFRSIWINIILKILMYKHIFQELNPLYHIYYAIIKCMH